MIQHILRKISRNNQMLGIELTDNHVKVCEVSCGKQQFRVVNQAVIPLPIGVMNDGRIQDYTMLLQTMHKVLGSRKWGTRNVHFAIPSQTVMVRMIKMPDVSIKELKKIIHFDISHNIHFPFENPYYDFVKLSNQVESKKMSKIQTRASSEIMQTRLEAAATQEASGQNLQAADQAEPQNLCDVMLVAAPLEMLNQYIGLFKELHLNLKSMEIKAFSLRRLIEKMSSSIESDTYLVVDINENNCDLTIIHDQFIQITRNVPATFGKKSGKDNETNLNHLFAEFAGENADLENACNEVVSEIERLMNFYRYTLNKRDQEFQAIFVSGDIPDLDKVIEMMKGRFNFQVIPGNWGNESTTSADGWPMIAMSVPLGLGLRGGSV